jgi:hypothetical protein
MPLIEIDDLKVLVDLNNAFFLVSNWSVCLGSPPPTELSCCCGRIIALFISVFDQPNPNERFLEVNLRGVCAAL